MMTLWIILGIIVIPAILNVVYAYTIVKFNLWSGFSEFILCDGRTNHKMDKTNTIFLIAPFLSFMYFVVAFAIYFAVGMYKIFKVILYPFIKIYEFLANSLFEHFNKIEDKREFYNEISKNNDVSHSEGSGVTVIHHLSTTRKKRVNTWLESLQE